MRSTTRPLTRATAWANEHQAHEALMHTTRSIGSGSYVSFLPVADSVSPSSVMVNGVQRSIRVRVNLSLTGLWIL
jgi:hypothetical protein